MRNGWVNAHSSGDDFRSFLENQEEVLGDLMRKLGFLWVSRGGGGGGRNAFAGP